MNSNRLKETKRKTMLRSRSPSNFISNIEARPCMLPKSRAAIASDRSRSQTPDLDDSDGLNIRWKSYRKQSSRVDSMYQVSNLPPVGSTYDHSGDVIYDQIWDFVKGKSSHKIDQFLQSYSYGREDMAMVALHDCDYLVDQTSDDATNAINTLIELISNPDNDVSDNFWEEGYHKNVFHWGLLYDLKSKDFPALAANLGTTVNRCMIYYYSKFKKHDDYKKFKDILKRGKKEPSEIYFSESCANNSETNTSNGDNSSDSEDSMTCHYCDDVGHLIVCDGCERGYHLSCLKPPLSFADAEKIDKWYCNEFCTSHALRKSSQQTNQSGRRRRSSTSTNFYSPTF